MCRLIAVFFIPLTVLLGVQPGYAADKPTKVVKQTPYHLYLSATEAHALKTRLGGNIFFADVRSPAEAMFVGMADKVDANIPHELPDFNHWDEKKKTWKMKPNPGFIQQMEERLRQAGLGKDEPVILICRSGKRSTKAAGLLHELGYEKIYTVVDGFEGDKAKKGPDKGKRVVNGWKNSNLAWSYQSEKDKHSLNTNH